MFTFTAAGIPFNALKYHDTQIYKILLSLQQIMLYSTVLKLIVTVLQID